MSYQLVRAANSRGRQQLLHKAGQIPNNALKIRSIPNERFDYNVRPVAQHPTFATGFAILEVFYIKNSPEHY